MRCTAFLVLTALLAVAGPLSARSASGGGGVAEGMQEVQELQVRVWLDRGDEPVLSRGDRARVYYSVSQDAFLALFHVDTNGTVHMLYPASPDDVDWVRGGRDYRLLFPRSTYWFVEDDPGMGYFFAIASPEPLDLSRFRYSRFEGGWDLVGVGGHIYDDPYVAMDEYVAALIPDWEYVPYALDFTTYHVGREYEYPRFLCYECHGFRPYSTWNPYLAACVDFRVVVYDDPYFYPVNRYRGDRVVFVRPPAPGQPRFAFKERARGESSAPLVQRRGSGLGSASPLDRREVPGSDAVQGPSRRGTVQPPSAPDRGRADPPSVPPARRPSETGPGSRTPGARPMPSLERRPTEGRVEPPARRESPPSTRGASPPVRRQPASPPTRGSDPPARSQPPPSTRGSSPPARSQPPPSTRGSSPPARSQPPPRRPPGG